MPTVAVAVKTGREGDVKHPRVVSFRMVLWRWLLVAGVAAEAVYAGIAVLPSILRGRAVFWDSWAVGGAALIALLVPGLWVYVFIWRVWVGPDALRGSDFWGRFVTMRWGSIRAVKPLDVPFLPVLRVYSTETRRVIWLPLFLVNYRRFAELVAEYAGADHPVTRAVWRRIEEDS
ncbi:MAG TPA: hypothetical protein VFG68_22665 [Fimbriiglobus sp.]|nr:hypothetical protein [Fimbriiglobus sp.]